MKVIHADVMGVCFGVREALAAADRIDRPEDVTILGELVHNEQVQSRLRRRGFRTAAESDHRRVPRTSAVLITAHGISDLRRQQLLSAGKRLIDTTCPLVRRTHGLAKRLDAEGRHVLVIGRAGHVEVRGIVEDLSSFDVVGSVAEVRTYAHDRLGVVCQTTSPPRLVEEICLAVRFRNLRAEIRIEDTVCHATRARQQALRRLLSKVDAVVVVGGRRSNNTRELVELCRRQGVPARRVSSAADLRPEWFADGDVVGLTAGTSTEDRTIRRVHEALIHLEAGVAL